MSSELYQDSVCSISVYKNKKQSAEGGEGRNKGFAMFQLTNCQCDKVIKRLSPFHHCRALCVSLLFIQVDSKQMTGSAHKTAILPLCLHKQVECEFVYMDSGTW